MSFTSNDLSSDIEYANYSTAKAKGGMRKTDSFTKCEAVKTNAFSLNKFNSW